MRIPASNSCVGVLVIFLLLFFLVGSANATVADIGCPYTYEKSGLAISDSSTYSQLAYKWSDTQSATINQVYLGIWEGDTVGYNLSIVNDNGGVPGNIVYATAPTTTDPGNVKTYLFNLNSTITLSANTDYWVVVDGRNTGDGSSWDVGISNGLLSADGNFPINTSKWTVKGYNGESWVNAVSGSGYSLFGVLQLQLDGAKVGDSQSVIEERTHTIGLNNLDKTGQKITNAPTVPYNITKLNVRMYDSNFNKSVYFVVLDENYNEIANRTIEPYRMNNWLKQNFTFSPAIEIGAGNSTIYALIKAPGSYGDQNSYAISTRAVQYFSHDVSYPYGERKAGTTTTFLWTPEADPETYAADAMMNMSITFGDESSTNDYFVSPLIGNDSWDGSPTMPFETIAHAVDTVPANSTLWLMPGEYPTISCPSNINIFAMSDGVILNNTRIGGNEVSNVHIDGVTIQGHVGSNVSVGFTNSNNITLSNCTIKDGCDGIRYHGCNNSVIQDCTITNMTDILDLSTGHGIHIYNQDKTKTYWNNSLYRNHVSDCEHNMIDIHSNLTQSIIADNDIFVSDAWNGSSQVGLYLHNGNTSYITVQNNTIHDFDRPLELNNANDIVIKNNSIYNGSSTSKMLFEAVVPLRTDGSAYTPMDVYGCHNITVEDNVFSNVGYAYQFYHEDNITANFTNFSFSKNIYSNIITKTLQKDSSLATKQFTFTDEVFTNFTINWDGHTITDGDFTFVNTSYYPINAKSSGRSTGRVLQSPLTLVIAPGDTNIWYGQSIPTSYHGTNQNGNLSIDFGSAFPFKFITINITSRQASIFPTVQPITVTSTSAQTDYPVQVTLDYNNSMRSDFGDVRFYDSSNTSLHYWLESKNDSTNATFWVKVPTINNGETVINATYGNQDLTSAANGTNVFSLFDDFEDGVIDPAWSVSPLLTTATETDGHFVMDSSADTSANTSCGIRRDFTFGNSMEARSKVDFVGTSIADKAYIYTYFYFGSGNSLYGGLYDGSVSYTTAPFRGLVGTVPATTANRYAISDTICTKISKNSTNYCKISDNYGVVKTGTLSGSSTAIRLLNQREGTAVGKTAKWDYVFVRKMADVEPTLVVGDAVADTSATVLPIEVYPEVLGTSYILLNNSTGISPYTDVRYINFTTQSHDWDYDIVLYTDNVLLPIAAFTANNTSSTAPKDIQFFDNSTGNVTAWSWDFNGDSVEDSNVQNPVYSYSTDGNYNVSLTVTNDYGSDTETKLDYIQLTNPYVPPLLVTASAIVMYMFGRSRRWW